MVLAYYLLPTFARQAPLILALQVFALGDSFALPCGVPVPGPLAVGAFRRVGIQRQRLLGGVFLVRHRYESDAWVDLPVLD